MNAKTSVTNILIIFFFLTVAGVLLVASGYALAKHQRLASASVAGLAVIVCLVATQRIESLKLNKEFFKRFIQLIAFLIVFFSIISTFTAN